VAHSLRDLHPTPLVSQALWDAYEKNVAPLILTLHKPTIRNLVRKAATNAEFLDAISEALVFAVYFAAVMSMKPAECRDQLGLERQIAIQHYRFAAGKALSRADSLHVRFLSVLQAAVLFLIVAWRCDHVRFVWAMTALVYRLAQGLGLHRDGEKPGLGPFETKCAGVSGGTFTCLIRKHPNTRQGALRSTRELMTPSFHLTSITMIYLPKQLSLFKREKDSLK
jgi:hypothetical protein